MSNNSSGSQDNKHDTEVKSHDEKSKSEPDSCSEASSCQTSSHSGNYCHPHSVTQVNQNNESGMNRVVVSTTDRHVSSFKRDSLVRQSFFHRIKSSNDDISSYATVKQNVINSNDNHINMNDSNGLTSPTRSHDSGVSCDASQASSPTLSRPSSPQKVSNVKQRISSEVLNEEDEHKHDDTTEETSLTEMSQTSRSSLASPYHATNILDSLDQCKSSEEEETCSVFERIRYFERRKKLSQSTLHLSIPSKSLNNNLRTMQTVSCKSVCFSGRDAHSSLENFNLLSGRDVTCLTFSPSDAHSSPARLTYTCNHLNCSVCQQKLLDCRCNTTRTRDHPSQATTKGHQEVKVSSNESGITRKSLLTRLLTMESSRRAKPDFFLIEARNKLSNKTRRKSQDALSELEELVHLMNLQNEADDDLLDRAERRDLPTKFQLMKTSQYSKGIRKIQSTIDFNGTDVEKLFIETSMSVGEDVTSGMTCMTKAPSVRRSAIPDLLADDLAFRRLRRSHSSESSQAGLKDRRESSVVLSPYGVPSKESYMLYNRAFTPSVDTLPVLTSLPKDRNSSFSKGLMSRRPPCSSRTLFSKEPDTKSGQTVPKEVESIEVDDVCYRKYSRVKSQVPEPPPAFGIPRITVPASTPRHYLNIITHDLNGNPIHRPFRDQRKVIDDMAVRNLRKDQPNDGRSSPPLLPPTTANLLYQKYRSKSTPCLKSILRKPKGDEGHQNTSSHQSTGKALHFSPAVNSVITCHPNEKKQRVPLHKLKVSIHNVDDEKNNNNNRQCKFLTKRKGIEARQLLQEDFWFDKSFMLRQKEHRQQHHETGKEINHFCLKSSTHSFCFDDESSQNHEVDDLDRFGGDVNPRLSSQTENLSRQEFNSKTVVSQMMSNILQDMRKRDIFGEVLVDKTIKDANHNFLQQSSKCRSMTPES